jgi:hypothetical protein
VYALPVVQAILPLRGKILNVERKDDAALYKNQEIASLIVALGLGTRGSAGSVSSAKAGRASKAASRRASSSSSISSSVEADAAGEEASGEGGDAAGAADPLKGLRWGSGSGSHECSAVLPPCRSTHHCVLVCLLLVGLYDVCSSSAACCRVSGVLVFLQIRLFQASLWQFFLLSAPC